MPVSSKQFGKSPQQLINVESVMDWQRSAYEKLSSRGVWGQLLALTVVIEGMDILAASLEGQLLEAAQGENDFIPQSIVPNIPTVYTDTARWKERIAVYQARLGDARAAAELEEADVCLELEGGDELCLPIADFIEQYLAQPVLYGEPDRFADGGEGLRLTNQLMEAEATFSAAGTLERYAGLHVESWIAIRQSDLGQELAEIAAEGLELAEEGAEQAGGWLTAVAMGALPLIIGAGLVALLVIRAKG